MLKILSFSLWTVFFFCPFVSYIFLSDFQQVWYNLRLEIAIFNRCGWNIAIEKSSRRNLDYCKTNCYDCQSLMSRLGLTSSQLDWDGVSLIWFWVDSMLYHFYIPPFEYAEVDSVLSWVESNFFKWSFCIGFDSNSYFISSRYSQLTSTHISLAQDILN